MKGLNLQYKNQNKSPAKKSNSFLNFSFVMYFCAPVKHFELPFVDKLLYVKVKLNEGP